MISSLDISYAVWKSTKAGTSAVAYYMQDDDHYKLFLVLTTGAPKVVRAFLRHDIDRSSSTADALDFETNYKGAGVLITTPNDAVAIVLS